MASGRCSRGWTLASRRAGASAVGEDAAEVRVGGVARSSERIVWPPEARVVSNQKKGSLDESPSDDGLPNKQMNKPKKSVRVNFLPRKKARKPMGFWAAKLALRRCLLKFNKSHVFVLLSLPFKIKQLSELQASTRLLSLSLSLSRSSPPPVSASLQRRLDYRLPPPPPYTNSQVFVGPFSGNEHPSGMPGRYIPFLLCKTEHPKPNLSY
jgi:hypothetical protein